MLKQRDELMQTPERVVVAVTGASGVAYVRRLVAVLLAAGQEVHLTMSHAGALVFDQELQAKIRIDEFDPLLFLGGDISLCPKADLKKQVKFHQQYDFYAGIASGSFRTRGMVVCPCSMGTLGAIANGLSSNLTQRAADVHLKERRKLILVPRETPLSSIQLENMKKLVDAGATLLPAMPGFYHHPQSLDDLVNFIVVRICDQLGIETSLGPRWGEED